MLNFVKWSNNSYRKSMENGQTEELRDTKLYADLYDELSVCGHFKVYEMNHNMINIIIQSKGPFLDTLNCNEL